MDLQTVIDVLTSAAVFVPIITGIVQVVKATELVPVRFIPVVAVAIGAAFGYFLVAATFAGVFGGIALGLASVGFYEFAKTTVAGK